MLKILSMLLIAITVTFAGCSSNGEIVTPHTYLEIHDGELEVSDDEKSFCYAVYSLDYDYDRYLYYDLDVVGNYNTKTITMNFYDNDPLGPTSLIESAKENNNKNVIESFNSDIEDLRKLSQIQSEHSEYHININIQEYQNKDKNIVEIKDGEVVYNKYE